MNLGSLLVWVTAKILILIHTKKKSKISREYLVQMIKFRLFLGEQKYL